MITVWCLLLSFSLLAGVFGEDDRLDTFKAPDHLQSLAKSVPALVQKHRILTISEKEYSLSGKPLSIFNLCSDEVFFEEKNIANCTGSLIAADLVLTAAHCLGSAEYSCESYSIVFDYKRTAVPFPQEHILSKDQVYDCKKVIWREFTPQGNGVDLLVLQLDRPVLDRHPVKVDFGLELKVGEPLTMIGHPLGISQKVVAYGEVLELDKKLGSFKHNLDTFSVNSGGPIFNIRNELVGVLVRSTVDNFQKRDGATCNEWGRAGSNDFAEGNNLAPLLKRLKKWTIRLQ